MQTAPNPAAAAAAVGGPSCCRQMAFSAQADPALPVGRSTIKLAGAERSERGRR